MCFSNEAHFFVSYKDDVLAKTLDYAFKVNGLNPVSMNIKFLFVGKKAASSLKQLLVFLFVMLVHFVVQIHELLFDRFSFQL